jgi:hypothetical protein
MNAEAVLREGNKVKVRSGIARQILKPGEDSPSQPDAYGELRYELEGDTVFFTFNGKGLRGETYYGLYSGGDLLGLGYTLKSGSLNIQGYLPSEVIKGGEFNLNSLDMETIRSCGRILQSD